MPRWWLVIKSPRRDELIQYINDPMNTQYQIKAVLDTVTLLSDEVMIEYINRYPYISSTNLRTILIKQSPLSPFVAQALEDRQVGITLNSYNMILDAQDTEPLIKRIHQIEAEIESYMVKLNDYQKMYKECLVKCESQEQVIASLEITPTKGAKEDLINMYAVQGNYLAAKEVIAQIEDEEVIGRPQEKIDYKKLAEIEISLKEENRTMNELTTVEIATLEDLSQSKTVEAIKANTILAARAGIAYHHSIEKPKNAGSGKRSIEMEFTIEEEELILYPNPVEETLIVELPELISGSYRIINAYGKIILEGQYNNASMLDLNTGMLNSGVYFIEIMYGTNQYSSKFFKQ